MSEQGKTAVSAEQNVLDIVRLMEDGKGKDVIALDISKLNSWTDYFIIVTITSSTHWQGLYKDIKEYAKKNGLEIRETAKKLSDGDDWNLVDLGNIVIHLMSKDAREFYDLEKLWHAGLKLDFNN